MCDHKCWVFVICIWTDNCSWSITILNGEQGDWSVFMPDFKDLRFFFKTIKLVVLLLRMPGSPSVSDQPRRPCFCLPLPTIHAPHATDVPRSRASPIKACPFSLAHAHPNVYSSCLVSHLERSAQNMDVSYLNRVKYVLESHFIRFHFPGKSV